MKSRPLPVAWSFLTRGASSMHTKCGRDPAPVHGTREALPAGADPDRGGVSSPFARESTGNRVAVACRRNQTCLRAPIVSGHSCRKDLRSRTALDRSSGEGKRRKRARAATARTRRRHGPIAATKIASKKSSEKIGAVPRRDSVPFSALGHRTATSRPYVGRKPFTGNPNLRRMEAISPSSRSGSSASFATRTG